MACYFRHAVRLYRCFCFVEVSGLRQQAQVLSGLYSCVGASTAAILHEEPLFLMTRCSLSDVIGCFMPVTAEVYDQNCRLVFISSSCGESDKQGKPLLRH